MSGIEQHNQFACCSRTSRSAVRAGLNQNFNDVSEQNKVRFAIHKNVFMSMIFYASYERSKLLTSHIVEIRTTVAAALATDPLQYQFQLLVPAQ